jgi:hypothetical protein
MINKDCETRVDRVDADFLEHRGVPRPDTLELGQVVLDSHEVILLLLVSRVRSDFTVPG